MICFLLNSGCSKELSPIESSLQGKWEIAKVPIIDEISLVYIEIKFDKNDFELDRILMTDAGCRENGDFIIEGKYNVDSSFIFLDGIYSIHNDS